VLSNDEAIAKFKEIIGSAETWQNLKDSQFVNHMAIFQTWALRDAQYRAERAIQEFFLSTALNQSSIQAQAEDKNYVPRSPVPSSGTIRITNKGASYSVSLLGGQAFTSNKGIDYLILNPVTIAASGYADVTAYQAKKVTVETDVTESLPFLEILFDASLAGTIYQIDVSVDDVQWTLARMFQNVAADDLAYDEIYTHLGQRGVRFGNNIFGKQPEAGSHITCTLWTTSGQTTLLTGQTLSVSGTVLDSNGSTASLDIRTTTAVSGGVSGETQEELRKNLIYWPLYQDQLVWKEDYEFFIRRQFPAVLWVNVWGETEAEQEAGELRFEFINKIFVSAYAESGADLSDEIIAALNACRMMNRRFEWVAPDIRAFTVSVSGSVHRKHDIATVIAQIQETLALYYDIDSRSRIDGGIFIKDIYQRINDTGYFGDGGYFTVSLAGDYAGTPSLNSVSDIDIAHSTFDLEYL